ncbi:inositol polyphosphate multikinase [Latimeria chalumnae]|uniref:inositol polyphosphate multikinase n=1 Tax=Latimeria chalumnae TaxID=7897 RepID=UPI00313F157A
MTSRHPIMDSGNVGSMEFKHKNGDPDPAPRSGKSSKTNEDATQKNLNGFVPLSHQVAGHIYGKDKVGILQHPDGAVLKQLQPPPRGQRELDFYNKVFATDCHDDVLLELQKFVPTYYGTWAPPSLPNELYLKLEDVTCRFNKPCIMDVKIGQKSYDPFASKEKIQLQLTKYPLMEEIGFLVLGMRVFQVHSDSYETYNQHYGRSLTKETIKDGLSRFFRNGGCLKKDVIAASIKKIQKILQWFENQSQLSFYASSLLFVYEGLLPQTVAKLTDKKSSEKRAKPQKGIPDGEVWEYNNNVHVINSAENGEEETFVGHSLSNMCILQKNGCSNRYQNSVPLEAKNLEQGNCIWRNTTLNSLEQPDHNNFKPQLEKEFCLMPAKLQEVPEVEVRMIDFAHVFPSNTKDEGYIYGLKHLITVLQMILDN